MKREELLNQFKKKARRLIATKSGERYRRVVGKLKRARLLDVPNVPEFNGPVELADVLWAAEIEPRILEVLPALMISRPKFLRVYGVPEDLEKILKGIRTGKAHEPFRGVPAASYLRWLEGRGGAQLKTFRMQNEDIARLKALRVKLGEPSDIAVLSRALKNLAGLTMGELS